MDDLTSFQKVRDLLDEWGFSDLASEGATVFDKGLESFLQSSGIDGRIILNQKSKLTEKLRSRLCTLIVHHLIAKYSEKVPQSAFLAVAECISASFPNEAATIYFRPYVSKKKDASSSQKETKHQQCSGKLWSKYIYIKRTINAINAYSRTSTDQNGTAENDTNLANKLSDEQQVFMELVKFNCIIDKSFITNWAKCYERRMEEANGPNLCNYFAMFPALTLSKGYVLLQEDFNRKYNLEKDKLFDKWDNLKISLKKLIIEKGKTEDMRFMDENVNVLYTLPLLFMTTTIRTLKSKAVRFSKIETRDNFILHIESPDKIKEEIHELREKARSIGTSLQPLIIFCGNIDNNRSKIFISVDDVLYEAENILNALDVAFKAHFALNLKYNLITSHIWSFIQTDIYGIKTEFDKTYGSVIFYINFKKT